MCMFGMDPPSGAPMTSRHCYIKRFQGGRFGLTEAGKASEAVALPASVNLLMKAGVLRCLPPLIDLKKIKKKPERAQLSPPSSPIKPAAIVSVLPHSVSAPPPFTTGIWKFAVCPRHTAKPKKHSAKALPSVKLDKRHSAYTESANVSFPSVFYRALGKDFVQ